MPNNHQTAPAKPIQAWFKLALLANRCVASSATPSQYAKYSSVCCSLAPCASSKSVGYYCGWFGDFLWKVVGQVRGFCTKFTALAKYLTSQVFLYRYSRTAFAQLNYAFTQLVLSNFNLLPAYLYPTSTTTMITTNLISKEI